MPMMNEYCFIPKDANLTLDTITYGAQRDELY